MNEPIRDILTTALLILAIALVWPSMGSQSGHAVHAAPHHATAAVGHAGPAHGHDRADPNSQCESMDCCAMTHCHPGMSSLPSVAGHAHLQLPHEPRLSNQIVGNSPDVLVPPPRALLA